MPPRRRAVISEESSFHTDEEEFEVTQPLQRRTSRRGRGDQGQSSQPSRRAGKEPATSSYQPPQPPPRVTLSDYPTLDEVFLENIGKIPDSDYLKPATNRRDFFDSLASQKKFVKNFDVKKFNPGSTLDFSCIEPWNLRVHFERQGWLPFLTMNEPSYVDLMRLFYSNLRQHIPPPDCESYFRGNHFEITAEFLANLLGVPNEGLDIFAFDLNDFVYPEGHTKFTANRFLHVDPATRTLHSTKVSEMFDSCRLMASILNFTVLSKSRKGDCFGCHKLLIYLVMNDIPVNLPKLILNQMFGFTQTVSNFGYGMVISRIFLSLGVDMSTFETLDHHIFGHKHVDKMPIKLTNPRPALVHPPPILPQPEPEPQPQPQPQPAHYQPPPFQPQYASYDQVELLSHRAEEIDHRLTEYIAEDRAERRTIMGLLNQILSCVRPSSSHSPRRHRRRHSSSSSRHSGHQ